MTKIKPKTEEIEEAAVEIVEKAAEKPEKAEKIVEKPEKVSIMANPYLSDEQKRIILDYELNKIVSKRNTLTQKLVLMAYETPSGSTQYTIIRCTPSDMAEAWAIFKENTENPTPAAFLERVKTMFTVNTVVGIDLPFLDLS